VNCATSVARIAQYIISNRIPTGSQVNGAAHMSHQVDHTRIEECIRQAKQERAKYMAEVWGPALKKAMAGLLLLLAALLPWFKNGPGS
jgi:hypothetical protein